MVAHRLGERNAGFVPIAIDLIEGSIQLWIITPATLIETWQRKSGMTNVAVRASRRWESLPDRTNQEQNYAATTTRYRRSDQCR